MRLLDNKKNRDKIHKNTLPHIPRIKLTALRVIQGHGDKENGKMAARKIKIIYLRTIALIL